ncbi:MAG: YdcF family protein [Methylococcaceae bacterium]|nr:YdcF family protein [Methylococcaceae bacterium]
MGSFFFWLSKLIWFAIAPDNLLVLLVCISLILLYFKAYKAALILQSFIAIVMLLIAFIPIGEWLLYPLESRFMTNPQLPEKVDGIVVLSGGENAKESALWNQVEMNKGAERDLAFLYLARRYPCAKLVFTGGSGKLIDQQYKEADVARRLFKEQGLDVSRVTFETKARNTYENGVFSYALIKPKATENWVLITTAWHMPRAMGVLKKLNWNMIAYPVDHRTQKGHLFRVDLNFSHNLGLLTMAVKEWLGLTVYYVTGKTATFL